MGDILIIHPDKDEVIKIKRILKNTYYNVIFSSSFTENISFIKNSKSLLVLLSTSLQEMDCLTCLKKYRNLLQNKVFILNFGRSMDYILECLKNGASHFFDLHMNENEIRAFIKIHFKKYIKKEKHNILIQNIVAEKKELNLSNYDIYDSDHINIILEYIMTSIAPLFDREQYIGICNALYEILVNAMEHGNLGISGEEKEELLLQNNYTDHLFKKIKHNESLVNLKYEKSKSKIIITVTDMGEGFNTNKIKKPELMGLCGRGLPIARFFFDKLEFNSRGNKVTLVKKLDNV